MTRQAKVIKWSFTLIPYHIVLTLLYTSITHLLLRLDSDKQRATTTLQIHSEKAIAPQRNILQNDDSPKD